MHIIIIQLSVNWWEAIPKPIVTSNELSRAQRWLHVFTSSSGLSTGLSASVGIGQSDFGFGFTTLD